MVRNSSVVRWSVGSVVVVSVLLLGLALSIQSAQASAPHAPTWSVGMFLINRCGSSTQQHCRWVATELPFYPDNACSRITYRGIDYREILQKYGEVFQVTLDEPSSKPNHHTYGWGVPTRFALLNPGWSNSSYWRYYNSCR